MKYYGTFKPLVNRPVLQPGYFLRRRPQKGLAKGALCPSLGPASLDSHDTSGVLVAGTNITSTTGDVTWTVFHDDCRPIPTKEPQGKNEAAAISTAGWFKPPQTLLLRRTA